MGAGWHAGLDFSVRGFGGKGAILFDLLKGWGCIQQKRPVDGCLKSNQN